MTTQTHTSKMQEDIIALFTQKMRIEPTQLSPNMDLYALGLDSLTLMGMVAHWRAQGYSIDFAALSKNPSINAWVALLQQTSKQESLSTTSQSAVSQFGKPFVQTERPFAQTEKPFSLAPMQQAYWLGRSTEQPLGGVSAHLYTEFQTREAEGSIDPERLTAALHALTQRHSSLRLLVTPDGQQIHRLPTKNTAGQSATATLTVSDLTEASEAKVAQVLADYRHAFSSAILDVEAGEVLAIALTQLPDGCSRLHLDVDMMAADAVSYRTLLRELALLYENPAVNLPELPVSYSDCRRVMAQRQPDIQKTSGEWWKNRLDQLPEGPKLPVKFDISVCQKSGNQTRPVETSRRHFHFETQLRDKLYQQCREHSLTPAAVLATVLAETLAGWSSNSHFVINVPLFLRPMDGADLSHVVGDFSSSIMLEVDMGQAMPFVERAQTIQARLHEDAAHADYNGVQVLRDLGRLKGRQITAPIVYTSALNLGELFEPVVRRVFGDPIWIISQGPQVLLDTQITELDGGLLLNWDCREDAFVEGVLAAMFEFFRSSVVALANNTRTWSQRLANQLPAERATAEGFSHLTENSAESTPQIDTPPTNAIERAVALVWAETIGSETDNIHLNLFAAGGDSVLATNLVARLREIFGVDALNIKTLFTAPSIAGIATTLVSACGFEQSNEVAALYCEIMALDDESLKAELEEATL